jgi:MerR family transcriptional regulator, heat shock protein HspR
MDLYGITDVSRETGVHPSSLRRWEDMGLIKPARLDCGTNGMRMYSEEEMELLRRVKELMDEGVTLKTAFMWATGKENSEEDAR